MSHVTYERVTSLSYSRGQRSIARLMSRGIIKCFSKAQNEKLSKATLEIHAALQGAVKEVKDMENQVCRG